MKMRIRLLIIKMSKLVVKLFILIIPDFNDPVFCPESIPEIHICIMMMDLYDPATQILTIEKVTPGFT
jgi:hypothetical protein